MTKVELYELIRRGSKMEGRSVRSLAKDFNIHRRTVRAALQSALPAPRKPTERLAEKTGRFIPQIESWLLADRKAPRKQRHTAKRIWGRLRDEHGCQAAESTIRGVVRQLRGSLSLQYGEAFVPQCHLPGEEAEVDFYESEILLNGQMTKLYHFCMRACHSGREFHAAFRQLNQQVFLEAHVAAFTYFGGVFGLLRYDNLKQAVKKVLQGRRREETERFVALRSHYLFESVFCRVGKEGAHEKGGVENGQGRFRRQHLVPVPETRSLEEYNAWLLDCCREDDLRQISGRQERIQESWLREETNLRPLPAEPFETAIVRTGLVDQHGRVKVCANRYSVPVTLHGLTVEIQLSARMVRFLHRGQEVAQHERLLGRDQQSLKLDHYLELLRYKPGALPGSIPLEQARASGQWSNLHDQLWQGLQARHGKQEGTRQMIEVLLLHRRHESQVVTVAVEHALELGCLEAEAVRHLATYLEEPLRRADPLSELGELAHYHVPVPSLAAFDRLLEAS